MENDWTDLVCGLTRGERCNLIQRLDDATKQMMGNIMSETTGFDIVTTDDGVQVEILVPGIKKEDISVKFQKDMYVVSYTDREDNDVSIAISLSDIDEQADANLDTDFEKNGHNITIALGILTIKVPYRADETKGLEIKEVV